MSYRAEVVVDLKATIARHVPDGDGRCVGCHDLGEDEAYPCLPAAFARHAVDLLNRRLAVRGQFDPRRGAMEIDLSRAVWRRPRSCANCGGNCVEVAFVGDAVAVRNSDGPDGPIVVYTMHEWEAFIAGVRDGDFAA